jgi:transketolase
MSALTDDDRAALTATALAVRAHGIRMATRGGCFIGASLSCADVLTHLDGHDFDALVALARRSDDLIVMTAENRGAIRGIPARRVPVVHALATFPTLRAFEFIRTDVGIAGLPVILVGALPGFLSDANGPTHQSLEDISLMRGIPGMQVVCPADREEILDLLPELIARRAPAYIRYNACEPAMTHVSRWHLGEAEVLAEGRDVTLLT